MTAYLFDTETTGIEEPEIIEAAWLQLDDPVSLRTNDFSGSFEARFKPSKPIELGAMAVHHIMEEDLAGCPPSASFCLPADLEYLIGYNVDFDWTAAGSKPECRRIDLHPLARRFWPGLDDYGQSAILYYLMRDRARAMLTGAHTARADVNNLYEILKAMCAKGQPATWEKLWHWSEVARVPVIMPFGKHKGLPMADVPRDYKRWLLGQPDVDPYLRQALEK